MAETAESLENRVSRLEGRVEDFSEQFEALRQGQTNLWEALSGLREGQTNLSSRIDHVDQKIDAFRESTDEKIDNLRSDMDKKFDRVDERFDSIQDTMTANFRVMAVICISILVMMVGTLLAAFFT